MDDDSAFSEPVGEYLEREGLTVAAEAAEVRSERYAPIGDHGA